MLRANMEKHGDTFMINLRFLLITSVFLGNMVEPLIGDQLTAKTLYMWIFTFHMPLFVFVTGYFARYSLTGSHGKKTLQTIGLQYLIFQTLYSAMDVSLFQVEGIRHSFFFPYLLCWFLMGHIIWRLIMLMLLHFNVKHPVLLTLAAGVLIGYTGFGGGFLSVPRALVYMPFFVIGYYFDYTKFAELVSGYRRVIAGAASVALFALLLINAQEINPRWLYGSVAYPDLGHGEWYAGVYRLFIYAVEFIASAALMAWVPRFESILTDWGKRTLYVFLLHGFVVRFVVVSGVLGHVHNGFGVLLVILFGVAATILLAQPIVKQWTHPVIEPDVSWLNRVEQKARGMIGAR
ncbi:acyltransferase family protein [Gorillibacterium sp. sgz5001074]|uniref:acyltransferase family protein n=1 Tax=Gorillibacterium sp. sgz5001074 TaxID=3446695 RepID=UPI003F6731AF